MGHGKDGQGDRWRRAGWRGVAQVVSPFLAPVRSQPQGTLLGTMRLTFSMVAVALPLLLVVLVLVLPWISARPVPSAVLGLLAAGMGCLGGALWARRRPLPCRAGKELGQAYLQRMFLGVAFAESPALLAFVAAFLADAVWPYLVGLVVSAAGLAMVAPTDADIARRDGQLRAGGCAASLREAVSVSPST